MTFARLWLDLAGIRDERQIEEDRQRSQMILRTLVEGLIVERIDALGGSSSRSR